MNVEHNLLCWNDVFQIGREITTIQELILTGNSFYDEYFKDTEEKEEKVILHHLTILVLNDTETSWSFCNSISDCFPMLQELHLKSNRIPRIPVDRKSDYFHGSWQALHTVDISHNGCTWETLVDCFGWLPSLRTLNADSNEIENITLHENGTFDQLTTLSLSFNR